MDQLEGSSKTTRCKGTQDASPLDPGFYVQQPRLPRGVSSLARESKSTPANTTTRAIMANRDKTDPNGNATTDSIKDLNYNAALTYAVTTMPGVHASVNVQQIKK